MISKKEYFLNHEQMEWKEAANYPPGTKVKILREENNAKTFLLKIPKGFNMPAHSHMTTEQHLVLKGQYEINGKVCGTGTYQLIPRKVDHGPFTSQKGALILVIWDPL